MKFSKNAIIILSSYFLLGACGGGNNKTATSTDTAAATSAKSDTATSSNPNEDKALTLIAGSDCTTCHRLHQAGSGSTIGPAYDQVAAKYSPAADTTVARLVKKIISGGSGIWGTVPMTPHPTLQPDDVKTMVTYILSLKQQ